MNHQTQLLLFWKKIISVSFIKNGQSQNCNTVSLEEYRMVCAIFSTTNMYTTKEQKNKLQSLTPLLLSRCLGVK